MRPPLTWSAACVATFLLVLWPGRAGAVFPEETGTVRIEAEEASQRIARTLTDGEGQSVLYQWEVANDLGGFSGNGLVETAPADGTRVTANWTTTSPELRYVVNFRHPGTYHVWVRGYAQEAGASGVYVGLNGQSPVSARLDVPRLGTWSWSNRANGSAVPVTVQVPAAGTHTLNIWMAEAGVALDRLVLSLNPNYAPDPVPGFWRNQSIYQIITDRFYDGDPSNNNVHGGAAPSVGNRTHGGDWAGLIRKLDYIKALGATAIWISPVLLNGKGDFDYHGYAATDFYKVDPRFGTLADLQRVVAEAHRRGLLVINDVVVNHASTWVDSAESGWPNFRSPPDGYTLRYNSGGRQYAFPFDNASLQTAFGNTDLRSIFNNNGATQNWSDATQVELGELASLDDFRTQSTYVRQRMREIWKWWIDTVGFDAYRLDTVKHVEMGFWNEWSPAMRAAAAAADRPNFFQFGEVFDGSDAKVGSYTGTKAGGNYKMESVLDYPLYYQVGSVFATATGSTGQIENRYNNLTTASYDATALDALVLNLDNHDNPRFLNATGSTPGRLSLALVFLYTSRGIPSLYYGTEQDFNGAQDPANREDMFAGGYEQGPSLGDNFNMVHPRFQLVAKLNNLRRLYPALRTGTHHNLWANWSGPGLFAYARRLGNQEVYVVLNTATSSQQIAARPTIHPAGTVLVNVLNPSETITVTSGTDGIPPVTVPGTAAKMFVAQAQVRPLDPVVTGLSPSHDARQISAATAITLAFDRAMDRPSVEAAFSTAPPTTGAFAWNDSGTTLTYTPSSQLVGRTLHAVRLESSARDTAGAPLYAPFEARFTTGDAAAVARPAINSFGVDDINGNSAVLLAAVTPNGAATTVTFEYGPTADFGTVTAPRAVGSGSSPVNVQVPVDGLASGTTYHYRVVAVNEQGTTQGPAATFVTTAPRPLATTTEASFVTTGTASLNGTVNPNSLPTEIFFQYGDRAENLDRETAAEAVGSGTENIDKWASIADLAPDTTYFFRIAARSGEDVVNGAVLAFRTLPVKPTIISSEARAVGTDRATLAATVRPNGTDSLVWFEYGGDEDYGAATPPQPLAGQAGESPFAADLEGLVFGRTYHFRAVAQNSFGTTYGPARTFTTGFPPPQAVTGEASVSASAATVSALINPNGPETFYWFEYGPTPAFGSSTLALARDDAEAYTALAYSSTTANAFASQNGGAGFAAFRSYVSTSASRGGIRLVTATSTGGTAGRQIDGAKSMCFFAGTSTTRGTHSARRGLLVPRRAGTVAFSVRFDLANTVGFSGVNLKSADGTSFSANELLSVGLQPASGLLGGNTAVVLTDRSGQRNIDLGSEVRGRIVDVRIDFDCLLGSHTTSVKFREASTYATLAGDLKLQGSTVNLAFLGFINGSNTGSNAQNLILDDLTVSSPASAGSGLSAVPVFSSLAGLTAGTVYHYRVVASNEVGTTYGANETFATGPDLVATKTHSGPVTAGGTVEFVITVSNRGAAPTGGTVTVTEEPPAGLLIQSMAGSGWTYDAALQRVTRADALAPGESYPPVTVLAAVSSGVSGLLVNRVTVAGGGDIDPGNNTAADAVEVEASAPAGIEAWRLHHFGTTENAGAAADGAIGQADGLANLLKYAFELDPAAVALPSELPSLQVGETLSIRFRRAREATDVDLEVEATDAIGVTWSNIWTSTQHPFRGGTNDHEWITVHDDVPIDGTPSRFLRLRVIRP